MTKILVDGGSRKREIFRECRLIWREELRYRILKRFHGSTDLTRRVFLFGETGIAVERAGPVEGKGREAVSFVASRRSSTGKVFRLTAGSNDLSNSVMPTPGANNPPLIVTPLVQDNSH